MKAAKSNLRRICAIFFTFVMILGTVVVPSDKALAGTISTNVGVIVTQNSDITYDGEVHYPDITFTPADGVNTENLSISYYNPVTQAWMDDIPGFKDIGTYIVNVKVLYNTNSISSSATLTIKASDSSEGGDSGEGGEGEDPVDDDTEKTPAKGVEYVKSEYEKSFDNYDSLGADKTYVINCEDYKIESESDEYVELLNYFANDMYSDLKDSENDNYNFVLPIRFFLNGVDFDLDDSNTYIKDFKIYYKNDIGTKADIETKYAKIVTRISNILTKYEKGAQIDLLSYLLLVHDNMCREIDFAYEDYINGEGGDYELHTADGVLENGKGLCDGYAYVFKYFMDKAGITCRVLLSEDLNHCWNMVKINGYWFHVDVAWDDLVTTGSEFTSTFSNAANQLTMYGDTNKDYNDIGWGSHAYFLKNDTQMKALGYKNWDIYYPADPNKVKTHPGLGTNTNYTVTNGATDVIGAFSLIDGVWYNADITGESKEINKWTDLNGEASKVTMPVAVKYLTTDDTYLYYVNGDSVYRSLPDGSETWKYTPTTNNGESYPITEFAYKNGSIVTVLNMPGIYSLTLSKPNSDSIWTIYTESDDNQEDNGDGGSGTDESGSRTDESGSGTDESGSGTDESGSRTGGNTTEQNGTNNSSTGGNENKVSVMSEGPTTIDTTTVSADADDVEEGEEVTIGTSVYEVTENEDAYEVAFTKTTGKNLKAVNVPDTVTIGSTTYKVTEISEGAFEGDTKLTTVKIGKNVKTIGDSAFAKCTALKTVVFGSDVETIGANAFKKDKKLTKIVIPSGVTKIETNAFYQCTSLKTIQFKGKKVPTIGKNAFKRIAAKAVIKVPDKSLKLYKKKLTSKTGVTKKMKIKK